VTVIIVTMLLLLMMMMMMILCVLAAEMLSAEKIKKEPADNETALQLGQ